MAKVCVLIPYTTVAACGNQFPYRNASVREDVTCKVCRKSEHFKDLKNLPRRFRK